MPVYHIMYNGDMKRNQSKCKLFYASRVNINISKKGWIFLIDAYQIQIEIYFILKIVGYFKVDKKY